MSPPKPSPDCLPINIDEIEREVAHLGPEFVGAFMLLQIAYWWSGPLPDDASMLAGICRVTLFHWQQCLAPAIMPLFSKQSDDLLHLESLDRLRRKVA